MRERATAGMAGADCRRKRPGRPPPQTVHSLAEVIRHLKRLARHLPVFRDLHAYIRGLESERAALVARCDGVEAERDALAAELERWKTWFPPGHFYSPIPNLEEVRAREAEIFAKPSPSLPGVDMNDAQQLRLLEKLTPFYPELPFPAEQSAETRFWYENWAYSYGDAIFLYAMLRHVRPRRVIEVGSGFSSAVMLDTRERFGLDFALTCIEPDPSTLHALLRPRDEVEILAMPVQQVPLGRFDELDAGDILFVDSTHVSKTGSDVNRIVLEILPRLRPGVLVHFHDVFYPFEYPKEWVYEGRAWNEDYLLRAFLTFNDAWEIVLCNTYLFLFHRETLDRDMPLFRKNPGGGLWLRRR